MEIPSLDIEIQRLLRSIYTLMQRSDNGWVSWRQVAKHQEGSDSPELIARISAIAELPEAAGLFHISSNGRVVRLSNRGIQLAAQNSSLSRSDTQRIAAGVKSYASRLRRQVFKIESVSTLGQSGRRFVQAVRVNLNDGVLPSETPVEFCPTGGGSITHGRLVGQEPDGDVLYIAFDQEVRSYQLPAVLRVDRAYLVHLLANSIDGLEQIPRLGKLMLNPGARGIQIQNRDSLAVGDALIGLQTPWTRFLWGPPGSGKTYAIGRAILKLLQSDPSVRILLLAPSNLAVDVALEELIEQLEHWKLKDIISHRQILRYGYPRKATILERAELLGSIEYEERALRVRKIANKIAAAEKDQASGADIAILRAGLLEEQEALKTDIVDHIQSCRVVATTTTLAYMPASPISSQRWDSVFIDEVTMVPPAVCLFLSSLAKNRFLLAGDPRQLGPVYERSARASNEDLKWMARDVFDVCGVSKGDGENRIIVPGDPRLARITSQRRCAAGIWKQVSEQYPGVESLVKEDSLHNLIRLNPLEGKSLVVLDTNKLVGKSRGYKVHRSWKNDATAVLALETAQSFVKQAEITEVSVAIITPYRAQVKNIRSRLRALQRQDPELPRSIIVGTIHQFQGSEADIVIFDLVDGEGRGKLGALLRGDTGIRLVNVAITRARGKVVLITDLAWCQKSMDRSDNPLLWDLLFEKPRLKKVAKSKKPLKATITEISRETILNLEVGQSIGISSSQDKKAINQLLHKMGYRSEYFKDDGYTDWISGPSHIRMHHKMKGAGYQSVIEKIA